MTWKKALTVAAGALAVFLLFYMATKKRANPTTTAKPKAPGEKTGGGVGDYKAPGEDTGADSPRGEVHFGSPGTEEYGELVLTR